MFQTKITSQGTISIPAALRRKYGLKIGESVIIEDNGVITITKGTDLTSLRQKNAIYIDKKPTVTPNGSGIEAHVINKYG
ncbi:MAG TPA: AbrB/MazE/SpoVT family DNA-binding domain-containing protein [Candidatus Paceibacterota bacterium]|nr:AbrB/MazE/SpoVT family DNA-binding domain-containing protein [Candidatus Paceibacterota bacterium]HMO82680.1 AbrB/MazE/SpoVT family DNA-binding domain-containing protein [Candidatus Paceibacterota bacterium]